LGARGEIRLSFGLHHATWPRNFRRRRFRQRIIIVGTTSQASPLRVKKATVPNAMIQGWEHTDSKSTEIIEDSISKG